MEGKEDEDDSEIFNHIYVVEQTGKEERGRGIIENQDCQHRDTIPEAGPSLSVPGP